MCASSMCAKTRQAEYTDLQGKILLITYVPGTVMIQLQWCYRGIAADLIWRSAAANGDPGALGGAKVPAMLSATPLSNFLWIFSGDPGFISFSDTIHYPLVFIVDFPDEWQGAGHYARQMAGGVVALWLGAVALLCDYVLSTRMAFFWWLIRNLSISITARSTMGSNGFVFW